MRTLADSSTSSSDAGARAVVGSRTRAVLALAVPCAAVVLARPARAAGHPPVEAGCLAGSVATETPLERDRARRFAGELPGLLVSAALGQGRADYLVDQAGSSGARVLRDIVDASRQTGRPSHGLVPAQTQRARRALGYVQ